MYPGAIFLFDEHDDSTKAYFVCGSFCDHLRMTALNHFVDLVDGLRNKQWRGNSLLKD